MSTIPTIAEMLSDKDRQLHSVQEQIVTIKAEVERKDKQIAALKSVVEKYRDAIAEALSQARAEWKAVDSHPGSSFAGDVAYYESIIAFDKATLGEKQENKTAIDFDKGVEDGS